MFRRPPVQIWWTSGTQLGLLGGRPDYVRLRSSSLGGTERFPGVCAVELLLQRLKISGLVLLFRGRRCVIPINNSVHNPCCIE